MSCSEDAGRQNRPASHEDGARPDTSPVKLRSFVLCKYDEARRWGDIDDWTDHSDSCPRPQSCPSLRSRYTGLHGIAVTVRKPGDLGPALPYSGQPAEAGSRGRECGESV